MGRQSQHCLEQSHQQHEVFGSHWVLPCLLQCPGCRIWSPTCPCSPQSSPLCPHRPCSPAACPQCPINTFSSPASSSFSSFPCSCPPFTWHLPLSHPLHHLLLPFILLPGLLSRWLPQLPFLWLPQFQLLPLLSLLQANSMLRMSLDSSALDTRTSTPPRLNLRMLLE